MNVSFANHIFKLDASGALFWPDQKMLIVSDLHLEKGSHFAKKGFYLPPYDSREILNRLIDVVKKYDVKRLLVLGDCFHDGKGYDRFPEQERALFNSLSAYEPIWIKGNHDGDFVPEFFESYVTFDLSGIQFTHEAVQGRSSEISGHFHPKVDFIFNGSRLSYPCFIIDQYKMIMPAFGVYTGGLDIRHSAYIPLVHDSVAYYVLGQNRVFALPKNFIQS